ncbi:M1 family aminopeptidase [Desulfococcus multivorans]|uniref:Peptidase M1, membrane alanine aminopeptidase n=1 Tax=Desulfococcus multivorans DSM 2059 TaxID=1121405 RepID=S7VFT5_DESML|nr:M1 family aminopeptidase [Desulfococcus multivorans]EPR43328.1 peptidase M1, membrane alanine aminopeptidase [Desulfococcus multivorans DSM 2059]SJZ42944.1 hypothetical protein SAMN02745446_00470 [Desulfococcus multivorans DSM 2059]
MPNRLSLFIGFRTVLLIVPLGLLLFFSCDDAGSQSSRHGPRMVLHDLKIRLFPAEHRLSGSDLITIPTMESDALILELSEKVRVEAVLINGTPVSVKRPSGRLIIPIPSKFRSAEAPDDPLAVTIRYEGFFDDPAPMLPVNTDNPGYGVTGTISQNGVFLLGGAGWYPVTVDAPASIRLEVSGPAGMVAVTAGKSMGVRTENGMTLSGWEIQRAVEPIALSAGPYEVREAAVGDVTAATYLFPQSRHLSDGYLAAITRFIRFYEGLFGPYPFEKFAVVENFFPTGYGFPSYTLMGTQVLHLPFIKETSLGHEIAHCWWGNGVGVDASRGNWCEGLTTYVSDYLYHEHASAEEGAAYRRQLLRNYAAVAGPDRDFPLSAFISRVDPTTKVVGYDKGAMVFHMLRQEVGDGAFWEALRTLYQNYLFKPVSWQEIETVFEEVHGRSLKPFFTQWIDRPGAVQLVLKDVTSRRENGIYRVGGTLRQTGPVYRVRVPVTIFSSKGEIRTAVDMDGETARFAIDVPAESGTPARLAIDPDADIFRRLHPAELTPSVNSLRGSKAALVVVPEPSVEGNTRARLLIAALGIDSAEIIEESRVTPDVIREKDIIFMGVPRNPDLMRDLPASVVREDKFIRIGGTAYPTKGHAFFMVFRHPFSEKHVSALFTVFDDGSAGTIEAILRKIPHYGKYGYLVFKAAQNRDKGVWPVTASPLVHHF